MIEKELGKDYPLERREQFLRNICDGTESVSYTRIFTPEELAEQRELLTDACIALSEIEAEKKQAMSNFKEEAKPYEEQRNKAVSNLRTKSEVVTEDCFKVVDEESKTVGFYNKAGDLVSSRPAFASEMQKTIFMEVRKDGTNE